MPLLFSYGTLQQGAVQLSTFGRLLHGRADRLIGYHLGFARIDDPEVAALSGASHHPIITPAAITPAAITPASAPATPPEACRRAQVDGVVFEISDEELQCADRYKMTEYRRIAAELASGAQAWVYVDARHACCNNGSSDDKHVHPRRPPARGL